MNLPLAQRQYRWLKALSLGAIGALVVSVSIGGPLASDLAFLAALAAVMCWAAAIALLGFLGNALGRFGLKYMLLAVVLNLVGFLLAFFSLRLHLIKAQAGGVISPGETVPLAGIPASSPTHPMRETHSVKHS